MRRNDSSKDRSARPRVTWEHANHEARQIRSDFLAESLAALGRSIRRRFAFAASALSWTRMFSRPDAGHAGAAIEPDPQGPRATTAPMHARFGNFSRLQRK